MTLFAPLRRLSDVHSVTAFVVKLITVDTLFKHCFWCNYMYSIVESGYSFGYLCCRTCRFYVVLVTSLDCFVFYWSATNSAEANMYLPMTGHV